MMPTSDSRFIKTWLQNGNGFANNRVCHEFEDYYCFETVGKNEYEFVLKNKVV